MNTEAALLKAQDIEFSYSSRASAFRKFEYPVLKGLNFEVYRGETLGIVGRNGCGKSSLLRILNGVVAPTKGSLEASGRITRMLLTLGLGFDHNLSGRDNAIISAMFQGYSRAEAKEALEKIKEFSELGDFFERPVKTYSSGMRSRLGFSTALETRVDLLLIDETLSVGDQHFKQKAEKAMLEKINSEQTVIFVSHSGSQIRNICQRAIWLEQGLVRAEGDSGSVSKEYNHFMNSLDKNGSDVAWKA